MDFHLIHRSYCNTSRSGSHLTNRFYNLQWSFSRNGHFTIRFC